MCLSFDTAPFKENYTNKESIYLLIVMMIILFGGSAQNNIACNISFISCGIRTINHQMIITRSSIYLFSLHSKPSFVSLTSNPSAVNVLRISSEVAQSLLAFAFIRCSNNISTALP